LDLQEKRMKLNAEKMRAAIQKDLNISLLGALLRICVYLAWHHCLTVAGQHRIFTGFPHRTDLPNTYGNLVIKSVKLFFLLFMNPCSKIIFKN